MLVLAWIYWRTILFAWAYHIAQALPFTVSFPYASNLLMISRLPPAIWRWGNFDGVHYLSIALNSYAAEFTQTFFPLYPLFIRLVANIFHDRFMIISGLVISNGAFFMALWYFYNLLRLDFDHKSVEKSIFGLLIFPFSFYFSALYTESLFFLLLVLAFWAARRRKWWLSSFWGALATATRPNGILLWPALVYEYWQGLPQKSAFKQKFLMTIKQPFIYLVPLGLISYMIFLQINFGDALMFWHAQSAYGAQRSSGAMVFPLVTVLRYFKILFTVDWTSPSFLVAMVEFATLIFSLVVFYLAVKRKFRVSYLIFSGLVILLPILSGTLSSFPRYLLPAFIIYPVIAGIKNKFWQSVIFVISAILLLYFSHRFLSGQWIA